MAPSNDRAERQPAHKATLYCTNCKHASHINGDWIIKINANSLDYECPNCGTTIDSRCDGSDLTAQSDGALQFGNAD
jgi:predicted RNA-binding Zn-ribbon protein involved in translation (DUF1610 family)